MEEYNGIPGFIHPCLLPWVNAYQDTKKETKYKLRSIYHTDLSDLDLDPEKDKTSKRFLIYKKQKPRYETNAGISTCT